MPEYEEKEVTEIFKALSHPIRQQIILILANSQENKGIGFTSLKKSLESSMNGKKIQVGSIYHHIGLLGTLLAQTSSKTWILSESGWFAHNLLQSTQDRSKFLNEGDLNKSSPLSVIWYILAPSKLFISIKKSIGPFIGWLIIFFLIFAGITAESHSVLVFLFFAPINVEMDFILSLLSVLMSWIAFSIITFSVSKIILKEKSLQLMDLFSLAIVLGISLLPLAIFPVMAIFGLIDIQTQTLISLLTVIILQLWVIILSARAISIHFFIRLDRATIVSVVSVYVMVLFALSLGF